MKNVIFLDVDGVLHPFHEHVPESEITTFHNPCMEALQSLVKVIDAEIILSSSWRNFQSTRERLQTNLAKYDLRFSAWIEPDSSTQPGGASVSAKKMSKILAYVHAHHPTEWIVLDDEDLVSLSCQDPSSTMSLLFSSRFVRTDPKIGLTNFDVDRAIEIIKSE